MIKKGIVLIDGEKEYWKKKILFQLKKICNLSDIHSLYFHVIMSCYSSSFSTIRQYLYWLF